MSTTMLVGAIPLQEIELVVVNTVIDGGIVERRKVWRDVFPGAIQELYQRYHVKEIQIVGPFSYADNIAHQIQEILPYEDCEIIVYIDNKMSDKITGDKFLTQAEFQTGIVEDFKKEHEEKEEEPHLLRL